MRAGTSGPAGFPAHGAAHPRRFHRPGRHAWRYPDDSQTKSECSGKTGARGETMARGRRPLIALERRKAYRGKAWRSPALPAPAGHDLQLRDLHHRTRGARPDPSRRAHPHHTGMAGTGIPWPVPLVPVGTLSRTLPERPAAGGEGIPLALPPSEDLPLMEPGESNQTEHAKGSVSPFLEGFTG
jgi:hypothetical protein